MNQSFGEILRGLREQKGLLLREVAAAMKMDTALLSKFERGERKPNREQVLGFAKFFNANSENLLVAWFSDKIVYELQDENVALKAVQIAEQKIKYIKRKR